MPRAKCSLSTFMLEEMAPPPLPKTPEPRHRRSRTFEFRVADCKGFATIGEYDDGQPGEIFLKMAKEGSTLSGLLDAFAIAVSIGLQYGVPLEEFVESFTFQTFEPRGMVEGHPNIKMANSIVDYVFRALGVEYLHRDELAQVPPDRSRELPDHLMTIQVAPDDCTGCGVCVDVCPAKSKTEVKHKAINMAPYLANRDAERVRWDELLSIPQLDRSAIARDTIKGSQVLEPLFEFSGACSGCGETPYVKLVSQLFGDRMLVANATGCSSIYGGNLPTTPWAKNDEGRGPAWTWERLVQPLAEIIPALEHTERPPLAPALLRSGWALLGPVPGSVDP